MISLVSQLLFGAFAALVITTGASQRPEWFAKAPSLPLPDEDVVRASTPEEILARGENLRSNETLLVEPGTYKLDRPLILRGKTNITIRSTSGDPRSVTLIGEGWEKGDQYDDILRIANSDGVNIAGLTFAECRSYGIKVEAEHGPRNVHVYNCRFRNIGVRAIKGSAGQNPAVRAIKGSVRYCDFENSKVPPREWLFDGDYIAAIDMMALDGWTFSDNFFHQIRGRNGGGRAAIFIWVRSRNVVVERNVIIDCDRGVAFGNPGRSTANEPGASLAYVSDGIIQNNFIAGGADCGIELWHADGIKVLHNSIWRPERNWNRGIRIGTGTLRTEIVNNLVHGGITEEGGRVRTENNLAGRLTSYFTKPETGDLSLTPAATGAIGKATKLPAVPQDIRGATRPVQPDIGAWEDRGEQ